MVRKLFILLLLQTTLVGLTCAQTFEWANSMGSSSVDKGYSIFVDDSGYVYTTGEFDDTVDFDPDSSTNLFLTSNGAKDVFVQK